jgi:outer membrane immunogenic protein
MRVWALKKRELNMTYKGFLLASAGGLAAASGTAQAADLPVKAAMPAPIAANWTGFYIGLHAGGAWQQTNMTNNEYGGQTATASSFIGGGQIGYNWQHGNFVYGVEADISGLSKGFRQDVTTKTTTSTQLKSDIEWLSTYRLRAGLAVGDTMAYMTGGLAVGGVKNAFSPHGVAFNSGALKSDTKTRVGWAIGGGVEHMWTRNWTVGLEGLFVDLGSETVNAVSQSGGGVIADPFKRTKFKNAVVIGRMKLNYKW